MIKRLYFMILIIAVSAGCTHNESNDYREENNSPQRVELLISAAVSLTDSLKEIQAAYEKEHNHVKLTFNFGASGTLQQQIEQGAPVDLFFSAGMKQIAALVEKRLIDHNQQMNLLTNELVAVVPIQTATPIRNIDELTQSEVKMIAIGEPETVPVGSYTKDSLLYYKLWNTIHKKVVFAKDVRQVLNYVETGNTDVGFVYKTDALASQKAKIVFTVDPVSYQPIEYPAGIIKATKHLEETEQFYSYLQSEAAQDIFLKHGFSRPMGKIAS